MHLLTSGDNQYRRHHYINYRKIYVTHVWQIPSLGEKVSLAYLAGMERLLPWQLGNCAITVPNESSSTSYLPEMLFEAMHINR